MKLLERGIWCVLFLIESTYNFLTNKLPTYIPTSDIKKNKLFLHCCFSIINRNPLAPAPGGSKQELGIWST